MGQQKSKPRYTEPTGSHIRSHPHFTEFVEVTPGCYHHRVDFKLLAGLLNTKTHMSVLRLVSGQFLVVDAVALGDKAKAELDELTDSGSKIAGVVQTHPYHSMSIRALAELYPPTETRPWFGCPRHLRSFPEIGWSGGLDQKCNRERWVPEIDIRVPAGAEFDNPLPPNSNHFASAMVFHRASKTVHVDDTIHFWDAPGRIIRLSGAKDQSLQFHRSIWGPGLYPTPEAPIRFIAWFRALLADWDFEHILSAHNGSCFNDAKRLAVELIDRDAPKLEALAEKNKLKPPSPELGAWNDESQTESRAECG